MEFVDIEDWYYFSEDTNGQVVMLTSPCGNYEVCCDVTYKGDPCEEVYNVEYEVGDIYDGRTEEEQYEYDLSWINKKLIIESLC